MKRNTLLSLLVAVIAFGIAVPWWQGFEFLDATVILASASVSLVFVAPAIASSFSTVHIRGQILRAAGFSWLAAILILVNGIATVNMQNWLGSVIMPPVAFLVAALTLNLTGGVFLALVTVEAALRTGRPAAGVQIVRIGFFLLLAALVFVARFASPSLRGVFDTLTTTQNLSRTVFAVCGCLVVLSLLLWKRVASLAASGGRT